MIGPLIYLNQLHLVQVVFNFHNWLFHSKCGQFDFFALYKSVVVLKTIPFNPLNIYFVFVKINLKTSGDIFLFSERSGAAERQQEHES